MKPSTTTLQIDGISVNVTRKAIKTMRLAVYPPDGEVRMSVPQRVSERNVRRVIVSRLGWIRKQQAKIAARPVVPEPQFVSGDTVDTWGRRVTLEVIERNAAPSVAVGEDGVLRLYVRPGSTVDKRAAVIKQWYRDQIHQRLPELLAKWQPVVGKRVAEVKTRWMKTRWGSCIIRDHRIWLNAELARYPEVYLEYVLVHEMVHLYERKHNHRFYGYMDRFFPDWREYRTELRQVSRHGMP
ncbi:M48 family metallopeptidase [bacterium]|nr:M48 family metallopeptidase [bacterium]